MDVITNTEGYAISREQAHYFAIQVFAEMKKYIAAHKQDYEQWLKDEKEGEKQ